MGILKDKDIDSMLSILLRPSDVVVVTVPHSTRASSADILADKVRAYTDKVEAIADNKAALKRAMELAKGEKLLIMAGSLYLVGGVRQLLLKRED